jgi:hypothetical protein
MDASTVAKLRELKGHKDEGLIDSPIFIRLRNRVLNLSPSPKENQKVKPANTVDVGEPTAPIKGSISYRATCQKTFNFDIDSDSDSDCATPLGVEINHASEPSEIDEEEVEVAKPKTRRLVHKWTVKAQKNDREAATNYCKTEQPFKMTGTYTGKNGALTYR